jgi:hypothetical protein
MYSGGAARLLGCMLTVVLKALLSKRLLYGRLAFYALTGHDPAYTIHNEHAFEYTHSLFINHTFVYCPFGAKNDSDCISIGYVSDVGVGHRLAHA